MADGRVNGGAGRAAMPDEALEAALRDLGRSLLIPSLADAGGAADPARRARLRIEAGATARRRGRWSRWFTPAPGRRVGRSLALALVALAIVAVAVGAIGLGLPGIRIVPAPSGPAATATASPLASGSPAATASGSPIASIGGPLGSGLELGDPIAVDAAGSVVDVPVALPAASGVGTPSTAWIRDGRLSFVWPTGRSLPASDRPEIGLVLTEFRGSIDSAYFQKVIGPGTTLTPVAVDGGSGWWISGAPHEIVFVGANGNPVYDRTSIGDTLIWTRGDVTYRLESGLNRAAAIALAETIR